MLIGEKIILRPLKIEDLDKTHQWRNNLDLIKLTQGVRFPKTLEMDNDWFENALNDKSNRNLYFGIDEIETGEFIGLIQLTNVDYVSRNAMLGFVIGNDKKQGKGYGYEANKLIIDYSFMQINLKKITSYILEDNIPSIGLFVKLGFIEEGFLREHFYVDGKFKNITIMSLINEK